MLLALQDTQLPLMEATENQRTTHQILLLQDHQAEVADQQEIPQDLPGLGHQVVDHQVVVVWVRVWIK